MTESYVKKIDRMNRAERGKFFDNHIFHKLTAILNKKRYGVGINKNRDIFCRSEEVFTMNFALDLTITKPIIFDFAPEKASGGAQIVLKFRPSHSKYHYSFEVVGRQSYDLKKKSRRFRYKNPSLETLVDVVDFLYKSIKEELVVEMRAELKREEAANKRLDQAKELGKAISANVTANVNYGNMTFNFKTMDGTEISMSLRMDPNDCVSGFRVDGTIKKHHFYAIVDGLKKSVPEESLGGIKKFRKFDFSSDSIIRIAKNEFTKTPFSKVRAWKRNIFPQTQE